MKSEAIIHEHDANCRNCGAVVAVNYCAQCGQETRLHVPSAGEFLHEFVGHYVALEGRLWKTLGLLLFKPGRLTREYLEGRRVRYVLPLRVYLTFSIIFFALMKFGAGGPGETVPGSGKPAIEATASVKGNGTAAPPAAGPQEQSDGKAGRDRRQQAGKQKLNEAIADVTHDPEVKGVLGKVRQKLGTKFEKFSDMTGEEIAVLAKAAFFSYVPYAVFALMPVFALYLKLLYLGSGRRYGEHLLFALHTNAFAFLMLSLIMLTSGRIPYVPSLLGLWLVFYLPTAMRKVYGGSRAATALRWMVLMFFHVVTMAVVITSIVALAITMAA